jgi:hypothetical protein
MPSKLSGNMVSLKEAGWPFAVSAVVIPGEDMGMTR